MRRMGKTNAIKKEANQLLTRVDVLFNKEKEQTVIK